MATASTPSDPSHASNALRGPHRRRLSQEQTAALADWLVEVAGDDQLSVRQIADFTGLHQPLIDAIRRAATSVSVGRLSGLPSVTHAVALLGTRRTLALLTRLARTSQPTTGDHS